jgi:branched-chain amino acid transport system ATP-binding protein
MREQEAHIRTRARELLDYVGLSSRAEVPANQLSYGQQRLLEIARALAAGPRLLLLDEPAAGLIPHETEALAEVIKRINASGVTVLMIEHDMNLVMKIAERIVVLDYGQHIAEGNAAEISVHPDVLDAYLGTGDIVDA